MSNTQTEFDVILKPIGENVIKRINVIKAIRTAIPDLGLKEALALVEGAPSNVKEAVSLDEAYALKKALEEAGAVVELK